MYDPEGFNPKGAYKSLKAFLRGDSGWSGRVIGIVTLLFLIFMIASVAWVLLPLFVGSVSQALAIN